MSYCIFCATLQPVLDRKSSPLPICVLWMQLFLLCLENVVCFSSRSSILWNGKGTVVGPLGSTFVAVCRIRLLIRHHHLHHLLYLIRHLLQEVIPIILMLCILFDNHHQVQQPTGLLQSFFYCLFGVLTVAFSSSPDTEALTCCVACLSALACFECCLLI